MAQKTKENRRAKGDGTVFQTKDGKYMAQITIGFRADGRPRRITRTANNLTEANKIIQQLRLEKSTGQLTVDGNISMNDFSIHWLSFKKPTLKAKTYMEYEQVTRTVILPQFGHLPLEKIDTKKVDAFLQESIAKGYSPKTVVKRKTILHNIMGRAVAEGILSRNPVDYSIPVRQGTSKRTIIAPDDLNRILSGAQEVYRKELARNRCHGQIFFLYPVLMTAYHTGMRIGEIFALRWENVDLAERIIRVRENISEAKDEDGNVRLICGTPKTANSVRDIDISDELCSLLHSIKPYGSQEGIVFTTKSGKYISPTNFSRVWRRLLKSVGLAGKYKLHEFRHTHTTILMAQGINPASISKRLGHASTQTTLNVYSHAVNADGRRMADVFNTHMTDK